MHAALLALLAKGVKKSSYLLLIAIAASSTVLILYTADVSLGTILSLEKALEPHYLNTTAIIMSRKSSTPFTGLVDVKPYKSLIAEGLAEDVVLTPAQVGENLVVIRGVDPRPLREKNMVNIVSGGTFQDYTLFWCTVGEGLAELEGIAPGDTVVVRTPFTNSEYPLHVAGIHSGPGTLNYEILVNKRTARILRNIPRDKASMIVVYKPPEGLPGLGEAEQSGKEVLVVSQRVKRLVEEHFGGKTVSPRGAMEYFLGRLGLSYSTLLDASIVVLAFSTLSILVAAKTFILQNTDLVEALKASQIPEKTIKLLLFLAALTPASATAATTAMAFREIYPHLLRGVLFYPPSEIPGNIMIPLLISSYGAALGAVIFGEKI